MSNTHSTHRTSSTNGKNSSATCIVFHQNCKNNCFILPIDVYRKKPWKLSEGRTDTRATRIPVLYSKCSKMFTICFDKMSNTFIICYQLLSSLPDMIKSNVWKMHWNVAKSWTIYVKIMPHVRQSSTTWAKSIVILSNLGKIIKSGLQKKMRVELELRTYLNLWTYNLFELLKYRDRNNLEISKKWI